jgi:threonine/homoserine/homoserine lactone efflux protein
MTELLAFVSVSALVIVTPGPDTAMTIRSTLVGGRGTGLWTAFGVVLGQACWTLAASAGIAALLVASEPAFMAVKFLGAGYLIYLGLSALWMAIRGTERQPHDAEAAQGPRLEGRRAFRQGLISDLSNPKMAAFFTSLLPQFASSFAVMTMFGLLFCLMTFCWLAVYAAAVARASHLLRRPRVARTIEAITGTVLVALGLRLAAEER